MRVHASAAQRAPGPRVPHGRCGAGIIDILQEWTWKKQLERVAKAHVLRKDPNGVSVNPPVPYATRFLARVVDIVFEGVSPAAGADASLLSTFRASRLAVQHGLRERGRLPSGLARDAEAGAAAAAGAAHGGVAAGGAVPAAASTPRARGVMHTFGGMAHPLHVAGARPPAHSASARAIVTRAMDAGYSVSGLVRGGTALTRVTSAVQPIAYVDNPLRGAVTNEPQDAGAAPRRTIG